MNQPSFFCSELSRRVAEKSFGTASVGGLWLLLEYPYSWGAKAFEESSLSPAIKSFIQRTLATIPRSRLLLIKRERACAGGIQFYVVRSRPRGPFIVRFELEQYENLLSLDIAAVAAGSLLAGGEQVEQPLFLVCTHGKRDKCCALYGRPLYKSLRDVEGDNVWQSSHVGGDRFAGNLVCFPHGLFYAHTTAETGRTIAAAYRARRLVLEGFRGRACYAYQAQAAEFYVRAETGIRGVEELWLLDSKSDGGKSWTLRFASDGGALIHVARVSCRDSEFENYVTCHATARKSVPQFQLDEYRLVEASSPSSSTLARA
ncbi:MAG TPA: sucrase ferredoxin [Pyrinomonadaceae bacterium]|nr:sucrase ferredoxin [Pyrinomonadaceae bacterium]